MTQAQRRARVQEDEMFGLMLLDAFIARYRRPRVRMAKVEPTYPTDGGCYGDF